MYIDTILCLNAIKRVTYSIRLTRVFTLCVMLVVSRVALESVNKSVATVMFHHSSESKRRTCNFLFFHAYFVRVNTTSFPRSLFVSSQSTDQSLPCNKNNKTYWDASSQWSTLLVGVSTTNGSAECLQRIVSIFAVLARSSTALLAQRKSTHLQHAFN